MHKTSLITISTNNAITIVGLFISRRKQPSLECKKNDNGYKWYSCC